MTEQERYLFDLQGYLVIPNALDVAQLEALNALMDARIAAEVAPDARTHRFWPVLGWGKPYRDLIDNAVLMPYLTELLGKSLRLDHEYADIIRAGKGPIGTTLHGGGTPVDSTCYYRFHEGQFRCGLVAVAFNLHDVNEGDGGFGCVPGSHKSNIAFPQEWLDLAEAPPFVQRVTGPAGTAILFTEALTHGTLPWNGARERRTLFYKYSPSPLSWARQYYRADDYPDLTPRQRELLTPPCAR
jgi:hypothetical protein